MSKQDKIIELDGAVVTPLFNEADAYQAVIDNAIKERDARLQKVKDMMGDADVGKIGGRIVVTWRWLNRDVVNSKELKAADPTLWEKVTKATRYRRFERPEKKKRK